MHSGLLTGAMSKQRVANFPATIFAGMQRTTGTSLIAEPGRGGLIGK